MKNVNELVGGLLGTSASAVGTALQTNDVLQTISLVITILGGIMTLIILPLINWFHKANADGKVTPEEIKEGVDIVKEGIDKLDDHINKD